VPGGADLLEEAAEEIGRQGAVAVRGRSDGSAEPLGGGLAAADDA
jgi:hypothetical protein